MASPGESHAVGDLHRQRLFAASCFSLVATSVAFAVVGDSMGGMKGEFILSNADVGWIGGAGLWGFTLSIIVLGPLCEALGMKRLMWFAFLCHLLGTVVLMLAPGGFWGLFAGALIVALGNGTVEAACNPLVATLYPDKKTQKLNQFHVWFPGGIVLGGLAAYGLGKLGLDWRFKVGMILIPTVIYGLLLIGQSFPKTERAQSGVSFGDMVKQTFMRPLFLLLFLCMALTASMELGPNRWVPAVLQSGGIPGILVLVWISGLMAVMRHFAGPLIGRFSPLAVLFFSALVAALGLLWLSHVDTFVMAIGAGTVFAIGVCYFWPTMLGVTSERVPKGGELALAMMGGMGMLATGMVTSPWMGGVADKHAREELPVQQTTAVLEQVVTEFTVLRAGAPEDLREDYTTAIEAAAGVLAAVPMSKGLPAGTMDALRAVGRAGVDSEVAKEASTLMNEADNYGGRMSFRYVAPLGVVLMIIFGGLWLADKRKGGYKAEAIGSH